MVTVNNDLPVIHTARLILRPVQEDDLDKSVHDYLAIFSDPKTLEYFAMEPLADLEAARTLLEEKLEQNEKQSARIWVICKKDNGRIIGQFALFKIDERNRRAEVGYILNREFWGGGYASEALAAMIEDCFENQGMGRLEADVDPENTGSLNLLERHGFEREGYFRKRWYFRETWYDSIMFGLLRPDLR